MCLIALAWRAHPDYELIVAANRDEFHDRPSLAAAHWDDGSGIFGGRDLQQGGGWLALHESGRLAAVTNVRRMVPPQAGAPSRGGLIADFLRTRQSADAHAQTLAATAGRYAGFNLLLFDGVQLRYCSNQNGYEQGEVAAGVHVLSNARLDTAWPKAQRLHRAMQAYINQRVASRKLLLSALGDCERAPDGELPDTGVGLELERFLSPPFIKGDRYGTRASTLVTIARDGRVEFVERRFLAGGSFETETRASLQWPARRVH